MDRCAVSLPHANPACTGSMSPDTPAAAIASQQVMSQLCKGVIKSQADRKRRRWPHACLNVMHDALYQPLGPGPHPNLRCTCRGVFLPKEGTPTSPIPSQSTHRTRARPVEERTGGAEHIPTGFLRLPLVDGASLCERVFFFSPSRRFKQVGEYVLLQWLQGRKAWVT
jgi:hypothetical protein